MSPVTRRQMLAATATAAVAVRSAAFSGPPAAVEPFPSTVRKFTMDLNWGAIGVKATQFQALAYAAKYGFESVSPQPAFLASLDDAGRDQLVRTMEESAIVWGAAGLPVEFRQDETTFEQGLKKLPQLAMGLERVGVTRVGTWLSPCHDELTYMANFRQHARRLKQCVRILGDHGLRFGMEYVGPKTLWASKRHSFIHTMQETKDLIAEINQPDVGLVLDSWHWYTAHETVEDLLSLTSEDIIACDLNDAPAGIAVDSQIDNQRELPAATGVIDLAAFLSALAEIGYDGPVRAEPFNAALNAMKNDDACQATSNAMKKAFSLMAS